MIEILRVKSCQLNEPIEIVERDPTILERQEAIFTQLSQNSIEVNRAQPQSIRQQILR